LPQGVQLPGNQQTKGGTGLPTQVVNGAFQPQFQGQQFPGQPNPNGQTAAGNQVFQPQFPGQQFPGQPNPNGVPGNQNVPPGFQLGPNGQLVPITNNGGNNNNGGLNSGFNNSLNNRNAGPIQTQSNTGLPGQGPNSVPNAINQLLTNPTQQTQSGLSSGGGGGGIAGVASTHTGPSIKTYNDRQKYEEWEFVYTPTTGGAQGARGATGATGSTGGGR
jgi:hypothetical protein